MADRKTTVDHDLSLQQLLRARFENLPADPTGGDLVDGRVWWNSADSKARFYDGAVVRTLHTSNIDRFTYRAQAFTNGGWVAPNNTQGISSSNVNANLGTGVAPSTADWASIGLMYEAGTVIKRIKMMYWHNSNDITDSKMDLNFNHGTPGSWTNNASVTRVQVMAETALSIGTTFNQLEIFPDFVVPEDGFLIPRHKFTNTGTANRYCGMSWIVETEAP